MKCFELFKATTRLGKRYFELSYKKCEQIFDKSQSKIESLKIWGVQNIPKFYFEIVVGYCEMVHEFAENNTIKRLLSWYAGMLIVVVPVLTVKSSLMNTVAYFSAALSFSEVVLWVDDLKTDQRQRSVTKDSCVRITMSGICLWFTSDVTIVVGNFFIPAPVVCFVHAFMLHNFFRSRYVTAIKSDETQQATPTKKIAIAKTDFFPRLYFIVSGVILGYFAMASVRWLWSRIYRFYVTYGLYHGCIMIVDVLFPLESAMQTEEVLKTGNLIIIPM